MSDKNFDQHLKSVLENLEPAYDASSWVALEQRMNSVFTDEQPAAVEAVDKAVFHTLNRMEAPYQSGHWSLMAQRLESLSLRLRHLRLAKLTELFFVLVLLWNFPAFFGKTGGSNFQFKAPVPPDVPVAQAGGSNTPGGSLTGKNSPQTNAKLAAAYQASLQNLLLEQGTPNLLAPDYLTASNIPTILEGLRRQSQKAQDRIFAAADLLPYDALAAFSTPERALAFPITPVQNFNKTGPVYLASSAMFDQNRTLVHGKRRISAGYGGALAIGYRKGKWGLEAGLGYSQKKYAPKREVEIYAGNIASGYVGSTLTEVNTDIISVPLKVTRRVAHFGKTTAHAVAGLSANFAAQKTYDYGTVYYSPDDLPPNFLPDPNQSPKLRQSGQGILEKGRLNDNFYASVDVGLRLEHPIAKGRYTAFVEPMFRQSLSSNGVGPKREPINTLSIQAGVMAFL